MARQSQFEEFRGRPRLGFCLADIFKICGSEDFVLALLAPDWRVVSPDLKPYKPLDKTAKALSLSLEATFSASKISPQSLAF